MKWERKPVLASASIAGEGMRMFEADPLSLVTGVTLTLRKPGQEHAIPEGHSTALSVFLVFAAVA